MTEPTDLIAEARRWPHGIGPTPSAAPGNLIGRLADALEASLSTTPAEAGEREALSTDDRMVIYANGNVTRGKFAAAAVRLPRSR